MSTGGVGSDTILQRPAALSERAYWMTVPHIYRLQRYSAPKHVNPPFDPFEVTYVDPDQIVRFTGREYPAWLNPWELFGVTLAGDWDLRNLPPVDRSYVGTDADLYLSDRFAESVVHRSLEMHFARNVPWRKTPLVQTIISRIESEQFEGTYWNGCTTVPDVMDRCKEVDGIYESIKERGCISMRELNAERGYPNRFKRVMKNEILVDVGRDGELLFVDGRHRLSITKILDFDEVPVAKLIRHEDFVEQHRIGPTLREFIPKNWLRHH